MSNQNGNKNYWHLFWIQWRQYRLGMIALGIVFLFCLIGIYAPFLASSKPLAVEYDGTWYFPLFRYLFYQGFYTKYLDIFFNLLCFFIPFWIVLWRVFEKYFFYSYPKKVAFIVAFFLQLFTFAYVLWYPLQDPEFNPILNKNKQEAIKQSPGSSFFPDWDFELRYMTPYARLNVVLEYQQRRENHDRIVHDLQQSGYPHASIATLWQLEQDHIREKIDSLSSRDGNSKAQLAYIRERQQWLEEQSTKISHKFMPLIRPFHWEDDAGGEQKLNHQISWWDLTRINRKDMVASLIFGTRISLCVGTTAIAIALLIGIPIGALAGFYGGKVDIIVYRLIEIWESMPVFFMLLMVVAFLQTKSIFVVISVIGLFGWTSFSRYIRGEFFKQKQLPYAEACKALGFSEFYTIFYHLLPNAIPPVLTLIPFAVMGAITSEAALSFLGLGEEGSSSWGVLMDEGRSAFPSESYLLWPPAILLTILLVAIAIVGDTLRDALDPKLHQLEL